MADTVEVDDREVELSNLDKPFFPDDGITKGDVVDYYRRVADVMLPHLRGRPVSMHRWPDGIEGEGFYQKEASDHFPDWVETVRVEKKEGGEVNHVLIEDGATLVYLANQAVLTPHVWLSRKDRLGRPDRLIFDLDPPEDGDGGFDLVREGARAVADLLRELDLEPFLMTTGSRGLHVTVPIERRQDFDAVRGFAREAAELLAARRPERFTVEQRKNKRGGRLLLDYFRNGWAQTAVPPYALRALPGAPVATPLDWDELSDGGLGPRTYTLRNLFQRLGQKDDPWASIGGDARPLGGARKRLAELVEEEATSAERSGARDG